jgi:hypothetical protein
MTTGTCRFFGGPLDGQEVYLRVSTREILTPQDGLILRYNRVGDDFWLDEWSRPITETEQQEIDRLRAAGKNGPLIGQAAF